MEMPFLPHAELKELENLYSELDRDISSLALATGLRCPAGCGACCLRPSREVEATVLEMLPLAVHFHLQGQAGEVHRRAGEAGDDNRCILYLPEEGTPARGKCGHYAFRPLICRLFGFSALRSKSGKLELAASRVMKEAQPETAARAAGMLDTLPQVPLMDSYLRRLQGLHPALTDRTWPLNTALAKALEWIGMRFRFTHRSA